MPLDLFTELSNLTKAFDDAQVPHALAGAVALAIHGVARATTDIDILVPGDSIETAEAVVLKCGFDIRAMPIHFASGLEIRRRSRILDGETLTVDLLLVSADFEAIFEGRIRIETGGGTFSLVSREGLIAMKALAGRDQDLADIRRLRELDA